MVLGRQLRLMLAFSWLNALLPGLIGIAASVSASTANDGEPILHSEVGRQNNESLLWGPYRPNLYFGVRPRIPKSLMTGLMWGKIETYTDFQNSELVFPPLHCPPHISELTGTWFQRYGTPANKMRA
jgi:mannosyl-oligosaccharide glucosidase